MTNARWIKDLWFRVGDREKTGSFEQLCVELSSWTAHNGIEGLDAEAWSSDRKLRLMTLKVGKTFRLRTWCDGRWLGTINKSKLDAVFLVLRGEGPDVTVPGTFKPTK